MHSPTMNHHLGKSTKQQRSIVCSSFPLVFSILRRSFLPRDLTDASVTDRHGSQAVNGAIKTTSLATRPPSAMTQWQRPGLGAPWEVVMEMENQLVMDSSNGERWLIG